jgi:hypothetical protein
MAIAAFPIAAGPWAVMHRLVPRRTIASKCGSAVKRCELGREHPLAGDGTPNHSRAEMFRILSALTDGKTLLVNTTDSLLLCRRLNRTSLL